MRTTDSISKDKIIPFLKWAGGKRWLTESQDEIWPSSFNRYYEPFLGGGAVFFHLSPQEAILSDVNKELVDTYNAIKENHRLVLRYLKDHHKNHSKHYYYKIRAQTPRSIYARAARMLYLNRTCWNGLYRVNKEGKFNVPIGTKTNVIFDIKNFDKVSEALSKAQVLLSDFESVMDQSGAGDFVFVDPPYTVKHNYNGFLKYNEELFTWHDQERLKMAVDRAVQRGAKVLVLNAAHKSIRSLYGDYKQEKLSRKNVLSGKPEYRGKYEELLIKCWC